MARQDFLPSAVGHGHVVSDTDRTVRSDPRILDRFDDLGREEFPVPEDADPDLVAMDPLVVSDATESSPRTGASGAGPRRSPSPDVSPSRRRNTVRMRDADFEAPFEDLLELVPAFHVAIEDVAQADLASETTVPIMMIAT